MRLSQFILQNLEAIIFDWVAFARTKMPAAEDMSELALRDDVQEILREIALEMERPQGKAERRERSQGLQMPDPALPETPSRAHALERARGGFEVNQMVSEFRALRATVLRLWGATQPDPGAGPLEEVMRFNEAIDQALAESLMHFVAEVDRARNLFLGVLGHDLRSPLGAIMSVAHRQARTDPAQVRDAEIILRSARLMKSLIDEVVSYARRNMGVGVAVILAPVDMALLARHTLDELQVTHPTRRLSLKAEGDTTGMFDKARMHQVLTNLVGNAVKYGDIGEEITVCVDGEDADDIVLHVHNRGAVIPAQLLRNIFEPLVRAHAGVGLIDAHGANMGLGLYIVREIVHGHSGKVTVTSKEADGTTFTLYLPRQPEDKDPDDTP